MMCLRESKDTISKGMTWLKIKHTYKKMDFKIKGGITYDNLYFQMMRMIMDDRDTWKW